MSNLLKHLSYGEIAHLHTTSVECAGPEPILEQEHRWERLETDPIPPTEGILQWCDTVADALLLLIHHRGHYGCQAHLLWDMSSLNWVVHANVTVEP